LCERVTLEHSSKSDEHSVELFVLGSINKFKELDNQKDSEFGDIWKDINDLPLNLKPDTLTEKLVWDYKNGFLLSINIQTTVFKTVDFLKIDCQIILRFLSTLLF